MLNKETIAINQDPWTLPAARVANPQNCSGEQWARNLSNGDTAVLVLNRADHGTLHTRVDLAGAVRGTPGVFRKYSVRDVQANTDLGAVCGYLALSLAPHQTAFVRLAPVPGSEGCEPTPPPACSPSPPPPAPTPPHKPLPPCPAGYTQHASGFWSDPDQKASTGHGKSVPDCGALCTATPSCLAFEVYDPYHTTEPVSQGGSACYTFSHGLVGFHADNRGLIRTCMEKSA